LGITSIYVTHDQVEAMTMADRVAVMKDGILQAYAPPDELYEQPRTLFVGGFVGNPPMNLLDVEVTQDAERGDYHARCEGIDVVVAPERGEKAAGRGAVILGVRPEDVTVADEGIPGEVYIVEPLGRDDLIDVQLGDAHVRILVDPALRLKIGEHVKLNFNTQKVQFFDPATEESLLWV
jgi:ABC-type sugar transport system ATPase subunit